MKRTNATLQVGALSEAVSVEAQSQMLNTDRATISATVGERAIVELPVRQRNVWSLASTTPGVLTGLNSDIGLSFRGAGQREIQNSLSLDGINASANLLAMTSMRPIAEAVTEVQVQTGSTSAEYGAYLGVHINVVTKSGTNAFHGSVFDFVEDDSLDERGYFENPANPKNPRNRKQFGAELDGPLTIPGLYDGRDKTFFMISYEGVRAEAISSPFASVPTDLMRQGNFSEVSTPIKNPATGQPFPGNIIPQSMLSPTSIDLLQYYPNANRAGTANNLQTPDRERGEDRPVPGPPRSQHRQQGPAEPPLQLAQEQRHESPERGDPGHGGHPAPREQELAARIHPHAERRTSTTTSGSATTRSTSTP